MAGQRLSGQVVLAFIVLCGGALGGGIYYLLKTQPAGSAGPATAPAAASTQAAP